MTAPAPTASLPARISTCAAARSNPPQDIDRITGNLGNLDADDNGDASDQGTLEHASLTGAKSIIGRGVIIHSKPNDPSQPPIGAAGSRQACGVIGIAEPSDSKS